MASMSSCGSGQSLNGITPGGRQPVNGGKGWVQNSGVGPKGPMTVTPAGSTQPGKQGKYSAGKR